MAAANGSVRVSGSRLRLFQAAAIALGVCVGFAIMEVSLRTWSGLLRVANLARQGDCAFQQTYLLTEYIGTFRPGHVIYFFFENDISDLNQFLNDAAMRAFVARPLADIRYPPRTDPAVALRECESTLRFWLVRLRDASYSLKAARWLLSRLGVAAVRAAPPTSYLRPIVAGMAIHAQSDRVYALAVGPARCRAGDCPDRAAPSALP
jgi:hypothetical protein